MSEQRKSGKSGWALHEWAVAGLTGVVALGVAGCKSKDQTAPIVNVADGVNGGDPAAQNLAAPYTGGTAGGYSTGSTQKTRVLGQSQAFAGQSNGENYGSGGYPQQGAPGYDPNAQGGYDPNAQGGYDPNAQGYYDANGQGYDSEAAGEQSIEEANQAPPPLPEYDQPPAPEQNDIWTPGYWNYENTGYYWVPGVWCAPPFYGALWTPPWWGYYGSSYRFHRGYWGPHVGYYGGINYGFGYIGTGYFGGYWRNRDFVYNRAVTNVDVNRIHNVYDRQVTYDGRQYGPHPTDRVSYNGGRGGLNVQPRPFELAAAHEAHYAPVAAQREVRVAAASNRSQFFAANNGRPAQAFANRPIGNTTNIAATPREQPFNHPGVAAGVRPGGTNGGQTAQGFNRQGPGATPVANGGRPGFNAQQQPGSDGQRPGQQAEGFNGRQPGVEGRGLENRPGNQGGFNNNRANEPGAGSRPGGTVVPPATQGRVVTPQGVPQGVQQPSQGRGQFGNGGQFTNHHQSPQGYGQQPGTEAARPTPQNQVVRPNPQVQQPNVQQGRPQFQQARPTPQVQQQSHSQFQQPNVQQSRPQLQQRAEPTPQARPQMAAPQQAPRAAPAPAPAQHAAPAPTQAPHGGGGGGGEHGGHPR